MHKLKECRAFAVLFIPSDWEDVTLTPWLRSEKDIVEKKTSDALISVKFVKKYRNPLVRSEEMGTGNNSPQLFSSHERLDLFESSLSFNINLDFVIGFNSFSLFKGHIHGSHVTDVSFLTFCDEELLWRSYSTISLCRDVACGEYWQEMDLNVPTLQPNKGHFYWQFSEQKFDQVRKFQ